MPLLLRHAYLWFRELSSARTCGMDANPISFVEIESWSRLVGVRPTPDDVRLIRALDNTWRKVRQEDEASTPVTATGEPDHEVVAERLRRSLGIL